MPTSLKLSQYYWDPTGVAVRTYTSTSSASSTHTGATTLQDDWLRIDCGGYDNMKYDNVKDRVDEGEDNEWPYTFRNAFTSTPIVVAGAGPGDGAYDDGWWKSYAYGVASVSAASTTGCTVRVSLKNSVGHHWLPNVWWIAVGK